MKRRKLCEECEHTFGRGKTRQKLGMYAFLYINKSYVILFIFDQTNMKINFQQATCRAARLNLLSHRLLCLPEIAPV